MNARISSRRLLRGLLLLALFALVLAVCQSCAPAATQPPAAESGETKPAMPTNTIQAAGQETQAEARPSENVPLRQTLEPPIEEITEGRLVELEWPERLRIGESDVIRLALVPTRAGYVARAEFSDHSLQTKEVPVPRPNGYELFAIARLDGVGFEIAPAGDQERFVPAGEEIAWRWTLSPRQPGQQRLSIQLRLRWVPGPGVSGSPRESQAFSRGLDVQVTSFLGLSQAQAGLTGVFGMLLGGAFLFGSVVIRAGTGARAAARGAIQPAAPNPALAIEAPPGMLLAVEESDLLRALFQRYARLVIENEFLSGYSGARTFLVRPIRPDECADALTIVKLGPRPSIQREFENYEAFVKDRLPPVTARIQRPPVALETGRKLPIIKGGGTGAASSRAAVQYTFIAEPNHAPVSLRRALLDHPDPALLTRLFETFGPNWWMRRRPYTFRLEQEYDALLPPHFALEPLDGVGARPAGTTLSEQDDPASLRLSPGDLVCVRAFQQVELRADGRSLSLTGITSGARPVLRLRWLGTMAPDGAYARVVAARGGLLQQLTAGFDPAGLPDDLLDPLVILPQALKETVAGTRSVIHGDLNLENVLVGPGSLVWLIDFAQTREGHPLFDFAHLESELIAHILAPRCGSPRAYLDLWRAGDPLLDTLHGLAARCWFDSARAREYHLALYISCLGALKYQNLSPLSKHCLYLTASALVPEIMR